MDTRYNFTRRAKNASYSNRTAKCGTFKGSFKGAVEKAFEISNREKDRIGITDADNCVYLGSVETGELKLSQINLKTDAMKELLK